MAIRPGQVVTSTGSGGGGGGGSQTLATITGTLGTLKGGTGLNATDLGDLRQKLGIANPSNPSDEYLDYCADTRHQPNNTIQRVDGSTSNALSDVADGLIVKIGDDQVMINLADGKQWVRSHTESGRTAWSTPENANLTEIQSEAQIRGMLDGSVAYTSQTAWLPQYPDNTRPAKVIIARVGEYLIACARYNMWWAPRPTVSTWSEVPWRWEGNSQVPQGLEFSGGVNDEDRIPAGAVAVLGNKENVDQDSAGYILLMTKHTFDSATNVSTYTGYFVDDDSDKTIKRSTSTIGLTTTHWGRVKVDIEGIADSIITADRGSGDPVFHGIIPEISNLEFPGYTRVASTSGMNAGDVYYNDTTRTMYVVHQAQDTHLGDLFNSDFEVALHKDDSNFIRGVFSNSASLIAGVTGAIYRAEDLITQGTISTGDTIEIRGHKSVVTKTDRILPINLGLSHGASEAGKLVSINSAGSTFALDSGFAIPSALAVPTITKSGEYEVVSSAPDAGELVVSNSQITIRLRTDDTDSFFTGIASNSASLQVPILIVKDRNNYIRFIAQASSISGGYANFTSLNSSIIYTHGSVSTGDTVRIWLQPDTAYRKFRYDATGEHLELSHALSVAPRFLYGIQGSTQTIVNNGNDWTLSNFETTYMKLDDLFNRVSPALMTLSAVANAGHGTIEDIGFEAKLQVRSATTAAGLTSATFTDLVNPSGGTFSGNGLVFRSKVAAGAPSGDDQYRDYFIDSTRPISMASLPTSVSNGHYVQFRMGIKKAASSFENLSSLYGQALSLTIYPSA